VSGTDGRCGQGEAFRRPHFREMARCGTDSQERRAGRNTGPGKCVCRLGTVLFRYKHFEPLPVITNTQMLHGFQVPQRHGRISAKTRIQIMLTMHKGEPRQLPLAYTRYKWRAEAQISAPETVVDVDDEVVTGLPDAGAKVLEIGCRSACRQHERAGEMRIVPDKIRVLLLDEEVDLTLWKAGAQRTNQQ